MRQLVVNADDFGLSSATSDTILALGAEGVVSSTSVLVPAPATATFAPLLESTDLGVGVHLAALGEDPLLLTAREIPTLVSRTGTPPVSYRQLLVGLTLGRIDVEDVAREWAAQIEFVQGMGLKIDHLDSHQHVHVWPPLWRVITRLAERFDIAGIRSPQGVASNPLTVGLAFLGRLNARPKRPPALVARFAGIEDAGHWSEDALVSTLRAWTSAGVRTAEIGCHPGARFDEARRRYRWGYEWFAEATTLRSPVFARARHEGDWTLTTYGALSRSIAADGLRTAER